MDEFLEPYDLLSLNHEEIENLNRRITSKEIESVVENLSTKKNLGPDGFIGEFFPNSYEILQTLEEEGRLSNSFYEAYITLMPKPDKDITGGNSLTVQWL